MKIGTHLIELAHQTDWTHLDRHCLNCLLGILGKISLRLQLKVKAALSNGTQTLWPKIPDASCLLGQKSQIPFPARLIPIQDRASQLGWHKADNSTETTHWPIYQPEETVINWHATDPTDQQNRVPSFQSGWIYAWRLNTFQPTSQAVSCCLTRYTAWDCNKLVYRVTRGRLVFAFSFHDPIARPAA